jgi:tetratricopeptide (TPR) repeat protein
MRAEFLRSAAARPETSRSRYLLGAYLDLTSETGPLHAQTVADAGQHLQDGAVMPTYQINTTSVLRHNLAQECSVCVLTDPRDLDSSARSSRWNGLCEFLDAWPDLDVVSQTRTAVVLSKLGFWDLVRQLIDPEIKATQSPEHARLALLRSNAAVKSRAALPEALTTARGILENSATFADFDADTRLRAAINLVVHHAKTDRSLAAMRRWAEVATQQRHVGVNPVLESAYWRGVSYIPFLERNHGEVRRMLDEAERAGDRAFTDPDTPDLLARENRYPLLETRGRAEQSAGNLEAAEASYQALTQHDPDDARAHIRLADYWFKASSWPLALASYQRAAGLGAPYTAYAFTQLARCARQLGDTEYAIAALSLAIRFDDQGVTPLVILRELATSTHGLGQLAAWCTQRLAAATDRRCQN